MEENKKQVLTEEQSYLQEVLQKFNTDQDDPYLTDIEKSLLKKVVVVEKEVRDMRNELDKLSTEITERQEKINTLNQRLLFKRGQSEGLVESLLTLR